VAEQGGSWPPAARTYLRAYADGVNAWLEANDGAQASGRKSLEYTLLGLTNRGYTVQPWDPIDSLAWLKAMAWDLRSNMETEIDRAVLLAKGLTRSQIEQLYPAYPYERNTPIIQGGAVVDGAFDATASSPGQTPGPAPGQQLGAIVASVVREAEAPLAGLGRVVEALPNLLGDGGRASARTRGSSAASTPRRASRCWPTIRT
jgi:penicillin amidase